MSREYLEQLYRFQSHSVIEQCLAQLHSPRNATSEEHARSQPWISLLLLKWAYLNPQFGDVFKEPFDRAVFVDAFNALAVLVDEARAASISKSLYMFMRGVAFQQFLYQRPLQRADLGRQEILFGGLHANDRLEGLFKQEVGVSIGTYLDISIALATYLVVEEAPEIDEGYLSLLDHAYGRSSIRHVLNYMSGDSGKIRAYVESRPKLVDLSSEVCDEPVFVRYPFLQMMQKARLVHPMLLARFLEHAVYDALRRADPTEFARRFGPIFEAYVGRCLKEGGLEYLPETELQRRLGRREETVDYAVGSDGDMVLIDAKAVEAPPVLRGTANSDVLYERTKSSIAKAVSQARATALRVMELDEPSGTLKRPRQFWLLVVTYKNLFVRNGTTYFEMVGDRAKPEHGLIPSENMYFCSVDEFELLCEVCRKGGSIASVLTAARAADRAGPGQGKYTLEMHIRAKSSAEVSVLPSLGLATDRAFDRVIGKLKDHLNER